MRRGGQPAAAPGILRRPAAAAVPPGADPGHRRVRRRPAGEEREGAEAAPAGAGDPPDLVQEKFKKGEEVEGVRLAPGVLTRGDWLVVKKGKYYQQDTSFAFQVEREEIDGGEREIAGVLTGTESEALLRFGTGEKPCRIQVHLCGPQCRQMRENPNLLHAKFIKLLSPEAEKTWENNLIEVSETAILQAEAEASKKKKEDLQKEEERRSSSTSPSTKKKKKKKKKKARRAEGGELRAPGRTKLGGKTSAKKTTEALFQGTGLDPSWKSRKKILKMVKKKLKNPGRRLRAAGHPHRAHRAARGAKLSWRTGASCIELRPSPPEFWQPKEFRT